MSKFSNYRVNDDWLNDQHLVHEEMNDPALFCSYAHGITLNVSHLTDTYIECTRMM